MPMIILAIRVETEIIFKMNYRVFLGNKGSGTSGGGGAAAGGPEQKADTGGDAAAKPKQ